MKLLAVFALAATALAASLPVEERNYAKCTPATYGCAKNPSTGVDGWQVCDVTGAWVVSSPLSSCVRSFGGRMVDGRRGLVRRGLPSEDALLLPPRQWQPVLRPLDDSWRVTL